MLRTQPIDWEVVDSFTVNPIYIDLEEQGASILRLSSHEVVGDYTFDMALPTDMRQAQRRRLSFGEHNKTQMPPLERPQRRTSHSSGDSQSNTAPERHMNHQHERSSPHSAYFPHHKEANSGETSPPPSSYLTPPMAAAWPNAQGPSHDAHHSPSSSPKPTRLSSAISYFRSQRRAPSCSSSTSNSGTSDGDSDSSSRSSKRIPLFRRRSTQQRPPAPPTPGYKKADLKKAIIFARGEIMKQVERSGKNALALEGWNVSVLRQGPRYRIQIEYTARPALVRYMDGVSPSSLPPFLEVIDQ
ncbi:hypothetical protein CPB86DRAFT_814652 [Serendipita vermifera]|nr:hypothetical protein CPB86DRAFT_814652 [Serendipita vermifera]